MSDRPPQRPRLALLTNILAPYRIPLYSHLAGHFDLTLLLSGRESNRAVWSNLESRLPANITVRHSAGLTLPLPSRRDRRYLHITPGYLPDLARLRPHAVISTEMGFRSLAALAYCAARDLPLWIWWGGTPHTERSRPLPKRLLRRVLAARNVRWLSYGHSSTAYLRSLSIPESRILTLQNSADDTLFSPDWHPATDTWDLATLPRPLLLHVGQFIPRKGIDLLLHSAARLQAQGHVFSLLLVGSGPEEHALKRLAHSLRLDNLLFLPAQSPDRMPHLYRAADCLVFPTLEDVWGLVANEALLCRTPVLASLHAGCTGEIIPPANRFDPVDPSAFDAALLRAVRRQLAPADPSVLLRSSDVASLIASDISSVLGLPPALATVDSPSALSHAA